MFVYFRRKERDMRERFTFFIGLFLFFVVFNAQSQEKKELTLEDLYVKGSFYGRSVRGIKWMNDGAYYTSLKTNRENGARYVIK